MTTPTSTARPTAAAAPDRLQHLPVTLFASVMGIGGLALAWRRAALVWGTPVRISEALTWLALAAFVVVGVAYAAKWVRHPAAARAELRHPIRMAFVPTATIGLLVLATAGQDLAPAAARAAWWVGAVGHLALTVVVLSAWFDRADIGLTQVTPAWFIPVVGNVLTPLAAPAVGNLDLAWLAFGVGVVFYLGLLPLVLLRLLLHSEPIPAKLLPTLAITVAPPAVIALSWLALTGHGVDPVVRILYAATLAFVVLVARQLPRLLRLGFALPAWAYTFPLAAAASLALAVAGALPATAYDVVAGVLLGLATVVVLTVTLLTLRAAARRQICVPE